MSFITKLQLENCRKVGSLEIDSTIYGLKPPVHIILTGPNGTGKTTVLNTLHEELQYFFQWSYLRAYWIDHTIEFFEENYQDAKLTKEDLKEFMTLDEKYPGYDRASSEYGFAMSYRSKGNIISFDFDLPQTQILSLEKSGRFFWTLLSAQRLFKPDKVSGPNQISESFSKNNSVSKFFHQYIVNKRVQRSLARDEGREDEARALETWFEELSSNLKKLFANDDIQLQFDIKTFNFSFVEGEQSYQFDELADGHAAVLSIFAELLLRTEDALEKSDSLSPDSIGGIVIIDELETHLHYELQERILPFLANLFPHVQFIVSTHSAAVISSHSNAVIVDLEKKTITPSSEYQGIPYGPLMKSHFGIESDFDLSTTRKLKELHDLFSSTTRTKEEERRMKALADQVVKTGHPLALDIWNKLTYPEYYTVEVD